MSTLFWEKNNFRAMLKKEIDVSKLHILFRKNVTTTTTTIIGTTIMFQTNIGNPFKIFH